jgi:hypothetical protein
MRVFRKFPRNGSTCYSTAAKGGLFWQTATPNAFWHLLSLPLDPEDGGSMFPATSVKIYQTIRRCTPEENTLHSHRCENVQSIIIFGSLVVNNARQPCALVGNYNKSHLIPEAVQDDISMYVDLWSAFLASRLLIFNFAAIQIKEIVCR